MTKHESILAGKARKQSGDSVFTMAMELARLKADKARLLEVCTEVLNHLYTVQDIERCREMARAAISATKEPNPNAGVVQAHPLGRYTGTTHNQQ